MPKHVFEKFSNTLCHSGNSERSVEASRIPDGNKRFWTSSPRFRFGEAGQNDGKNRKRRKKSPQKIKSHTSLVNTVLGIILIISGLVWFVFLYKAPVNQTQTNDFSKEPIVADTAFENNFEESNIKGIVIPRLNIDLVVTPSKINNGYWEVSETSASHGQGSANPGEAGNMVVFAHAREGLFLGLRDVKKGDTVYILSKDQWYKYRVSEIVSVYPNDITTVAPTDSEILTLFTCSGFFDEKRLIVKAVPS